MGGAARRMLADSSFLPARPHPSARHTLVLQGWEYTIISSGKADTAEASHRHGQQKHRALNAAGPRCGGLSAPTTDPVPQTVPVRLADNLRGPSALFSEKVGSTGGLRLERAVLSA